jgi:hypothetical protein
MKRRVIQHQPSWRLASSSVEAFVTERGGHLGPVVFDRKGQRIAPYAIAPWSGEKLPRNTLPVIQALRGDFFCMPFGGNATPFHGEHHPAHGETANARWKFESLEGGCLHLSLRTGIRRGRVDKHILVRDGHNAVYCQHVISGMTGPMGLGHHAMLKFPDEPGSGIVSTSPFVFGQVFPGQLERPETGGYSSLKAGATFKSLTCVPMMDGGETDLTSYPSRRGFEDLAMIVSAAAPLAWTAVTFPSQGFVWFALKDPSVLRSTILWISNGGRHYAPWSGRHVNVLGLEEVTANFHLGLAESARKNPLAAQGMPTCIQLNARRPTVINYIMGVAKIPAGFGRVVSVDAGAGIVTLHAAGGPKIIVPLDADFLAAAPITLADGTWKRQND